MIRHTLFALLCAGALAGCATGPGPAKPTTADLERLRAAETEALETAQTGQSVNWENPASGHRGSVTVLQTDAEGDRPCRRTQRVFNAGDTTRTGTARACRTEAGEWEVVRESPLRTAREERRAREFRYHSWYSSGFHYGPRYGVYSYTGPFHPYYGVHRPYYW